MIPTPKKKKQSGNIPYTLLITPEIRKDLFELKTFQEFEIQDWLREVIRYAISEVKKSHGAF